MKRQTKHLYSNAFFIITNGGQIRALQQYSSYFVKKFYRFITKTH
jgi:hypothetical protein